MRMVGVSYSSYSSVRVARRERTREEHTRARNRTTAQRSVLKGLLNLSLPSKTAHIYRRYRGGAGPRSWPFVKSTGLSILRPVHPLRNDPIATIGLDRVVCPSPLRFDDKDKSSRISGESRISGVFPRIARTRRILTTSLVLYRGAKY